MHQPRLVERLDQVCLGSDLRPHDNRLEVLITHFWISKVVQNQRQESNTLQQPRLEWCEESATSHGIILECTSLIWKTSLTDSLPPSASTRSSMSKAKRAPVPHVGHVSLTPNPALPWKWGFNSLNAGSSVFQISVSSWYILSVSLELKASRYSFICSCMTRQSRASESAPGDHAPVLRAMTSTNVLIMNELSNAVG